MRITLTREYPDQILKIHVGSFSLAIDSTELRPAWLFQVIIQVFYSLVPAFSFQLKSNLSLILFDETISGFVTRRVL